MDSTKLYPLKFAPILKHQIWGGDKIRNIYRHDIPHMEKVGESWDVSALGDDDSEVTNGFLEGNSLKDLIEVYMGDLVGDRIYSKYGVDFPILLKIIDAKEPLSIQVHPGQMEADGVLRNGKNEIWYILDAEPGAYVIAGFNRYVSKPEFVEHIHNNTLDEVLNRISVKRGDMVYVPSGCVHSIGGGCLICEIQQSSDVIYRVYDYNRSDDNGNRRPLHIDKAVETIDYEHWENKRIDIKHQCDDIVNVVDNEFFTVNCIEIDKPKEYEVGVIDSFVLLTCVEGHVTCKFYDDYLTIVDGETILIPAEMTTLYLVPTVPSKLLETYVKIEK